VFVLGDLQYNTATGIDSKHRDVQNAAKEVRHMTQTLSRQEQHQAQHKKYVLSSWSAQGALNAPVVTRGEGRFFFDEDNNKYLDLSSGLVSTNLGHGHPRLVKAIQDQAATLCYSPTSYFHDKRAELGEAIIKLTPWAEGGRAFFTTGGAEANDDAVRIARALTGRFKILASYRSYHGSTGTAMQLTGEDRRFGNEPALAPGIVHFFAPYPYRSPFYTQDPLEETARALEHLERTLMHENARNVAAILLEPVVGSNGVIVYPEGYLAGVRQICDQHGILLIFDEVMTGFWRTGKAFAAHTFGVTPDMMVFAKGVTSAYIPLGGVLLREGLAQHFDTKVLPVGHTYAGHPLCCATGLAAIAAYQEDGIEAHVAKLEGWLRTGLKELESRYEVLGEARGLGAFWALEFVKDKATREPLVAWHGEGPGVMKNFYAELKKRGVYSFGKFNIAMVTPPLNTSRDELDLGLEALDAACKVLNSSL
jgi:taurine---2-oxoglutarate transaminase